MLVKGTPGGRLNIRMPYQNINSHYKDKTVSQPSYLYNWNSFTWKDYLYIETGPGIYMAIVFLFNWWRIYASVMWVRVGSANGFVACSAPTLTWTPWNNLEWNLKQDRIIISKKKIIPSTDCLFRYHWKQRVVMMPNLPIGYRYEKIRCY